MQRVTRRLALTILLALGLPVVSMSTLPFRQWLFEYIPATYPNAKMTDHTHWLQAHITEDLVASWTEWTDEDSTLKAMEGHNLTPGKAMFIEQKGRKKDWADHPAVTYYEGAGYYISGYDPATMGSWDGKGLSVIQFDGDSRELAETIAKAWAATPKGAPRPTGATGEQEEEKEPVAGSPYVPHPDKVVVTKVKHFDNMCWKIAAAGGTWYFENGETEGKSGFSSAFDQAGNDWIGNDADRGYNKSPSSGGRHEYRGWPNFGEGNFDHPQRSSGATTRWVDVHGNTIPFMDGLEGDHLIMRSSNPDYELEYHFFPTHAAIRVLKADRKYAFLYEGPIGGEQEASVEKDYYVLRDGEHRECKTGGLGYLEPDFGNRFPSPFFYLVDSDPKDRQVLYVGVKDVGPDSAGDEGWRQGKNMVIFSFGRDEDKRAYTGTDAVCVFGFHRKAPHIDIANFIEARLAAPFEPAASDSAPNDFEKLRVIMMSDFPPIGVVKGGDAPNTMKSDPDDMQSMVRFLLYANEFDVEGLIASAGTFAMEAHKRNILSVIDRYEKVYENLTKHDPDYPTPDDLRSVTYEGKGNNHGVNIKWGQGKQPYTDIIGEGMDSEASNAIIAAADRPDPRPLWIGVWGGPREVAQAIWDVKNTRSEEELKAFIGKLRIFLIAYQDATHGWLMDEFPDLFIIDSRKTYQGMFGGSDPISDLAWVNEHIRHNHGPLCDVYPHEGMGCTGVCEGDSPTFLYLVSANRGINDPEDPTRPSWGGQYKRKPNTNHYVDGPGRSSISRWRPDYQKEFAERADWCVDAAPEAAPSAEPAKTSTATSTAIFAVNCGGGAYTSSDGTEYAADTGYAGGSTFSNTESISGTADATLYQSERYGDCTYSVEIPNGRYLVTLHFAETFHPDAGLRSFDVRVEGAEHVSDLDLYAKAGANAAYVAQADVVVRDGELNVEFVTDVENAKINAIKVSPAGADAAAPVAGRTRSPPESKPMQNKTTEPTVDPAPLKAGGSLGQKPRIINTTDLGADPDDEQSMVRQLVCANEYDIEGLIVATGCWKKNQSNTAMLDRIVNAYGEVVDNLRVHAEGYPSLDYLKSISVMGQTGYGMGDVGAGKDSPGSELIIAAVDKDDPRPVWVTGWGGVNNVAQAVWKVRETRSAAELAAFLSKLRVFDILGQDDAGAWLAKNFPDLLYIRATGVYGWQPSDEYLKEHIQSHGPLGAVYPDRKWATEGDTPAFMHVYPNGLNDPDRIDQGGWGGRFSLEKKVGIRSMSEVPKINKEAETQYDPYYMYGNTAEGARAIKRWSKGYDNDFAARMDWSITGNYADANHHPVAVVNGDTSRQVLETTAPPGSRLALSAEGSSDPDGDALNYAWSFYREPGSYEGDVKIGNSASASAVVAVPSDASGKSLHVILELHDDGTPSLYAYRRVIIDVQ